MSPLRDKVSDLLKKRLPEIIEIRQHLHQYPELSFQEFETQAFLRNKLESAGIQQKNIADTGIVAKIEGRNPGSKLIVLRADIDALPIQENTGLPFSSRIDGVMHACGHDVHSSCVYGAGLILNELKNELEGTVKLLFQPGEEVLPGGATKVIASGELDNPKPDMIIGQHVFPELEAGKLGFRPGLYMASADEIYIDIWGPGGHAAMPEKTIDTVKVASKLIIMLKDVVDLSEKPVPTVLTFGKIEGKGATNVIPKHVHIEGTFRTLDEDWRAEIHHRLKTVSHELSVDSGAKIDLEIRKGYPCLINDEKITESIKNRAMNYLGKENVVNLDIRMTSEDFAFYTRLYKSCFYRLGIRTPGKDITKLHSPDFSADEKAIETGVGFMVYLVLKELEKNDL